MKFGFNLPGRRTKAGIVALAGIVLATGCLILRARVSDDSTRRLLSNLQSGTQVYFDEGYYRDTLYAARVTAFDSGRQILFGGQDSMRGSTLPDEDGTNCYPVVSESSLSYRRGIHFGTLTNLVYQSRNTPGLILNPGTGSFAEKQGMPVRTVDENRSRYAGANFGLSQASQIHVHAGLSDVRRGSVGCLTIDPNEAVAFFDSEIGPSGTVHIRR
jgi:hypothetical protein